MLNPFDLEADDRKFVWAVRENRLLEQRILQLSIARSWASVAIVIQLIFIGIMLALDSRKAMSDSSWTLFIFALNFALVAYLDLQIKFLKVRQHENKSARSEEPKPETLSRG